MPSAWRRWGVMSSAVSPVSTCSRVLVGQGKPGFLRAPAWVNGVEVQRQRGGGGRGASSAGWETFDFAYTRVLRSGPGGTRQERAGTEARSANWLQIGYKLLAPGGRLGSASAADEP